MSTTEPLPTSADAHPDAELRRLREEVARLRELVGPDEVSYVQRKVEVWAARDAVIGAEAENGTLRARVRALEQALRDIGERPDLTATRTWKAGRAVLTPVRALKRLLGMPVA
jgi:predicted  nucleic acid-binding Zn-ribbon protein